jgi:L-threonylcarbamoyladenylate synthase
LLLIINRPLTGTSANISGKSASTKIKEVLKQFKNQKYQPDLVVSAGNLSKSKPSLVIDLTREPPKILRT